MTLFRDRSNTVIKVWAGKDDEPFICAANGEFTVEVLAEMESALGEEGEHEFSSGPGEYTYIACYEDGQYDDMGRCEIAPYWDFIELGFERPAYMDIVEEREERVANNPEEPCDDCGDFGCFLKHHCQPPF